MTEKQIKSAIRKCHWRDDCMNGKHRDMRAVICRGLCLPCLKVIDDGKCDTLIELFKAESEGDEE